MTPWQSAFRKPRFRKRGHARTKRITARNIKSFLGWHNTWADPHREEWREVHERLVRERKSRRRARAKKVSEA